MTVIFYSQVLINYRAMIVCIRGGTSRHPCPTCLIKKDDIMAHLPQDADKCTLRTNTAMRDVYNRAREIGGSNGEALLKENGLREVEVRYLL